MYIYGGEFETCEIFVWKYRFGKRNDRIGSKILLLFRCFFWTKLSSTHYFDGVSWSIDSLPEFQEDD